MENGFSCITVIFPMVRRCDVSSRKRAPRKFIIWRDSAMSDRAKVQRTLGWKPTGAFPDLVREMVEAGLAAIDEGGKTRRSVVTINE